MLTASTEGIAFVIAYGDGGHTMVCCLETPALVTTPRKLKAAAPVSRVS